ncbi:Large cysteine-rich periplasmic protein OmcB precursor [Maioricimonas rarisocia]|uniref:Large cysteine-rich periplasmic protein OmcB n=1 Tax=Maioricimonas rarisocia TaxID=2528026 RepID=A0A517Z8U7_9PLAN|nr:DUF11 domain-containing protein [Maioricimonas rarisocia]QDU38895.1 Large cysteine-rich periplasmic protein OmcB precursor [Maioricimonas rarisocia]
MLNALWKGIALVGVIAVGCIVVVQAQHVLNQQKPDASSGDFAKLDGDSSGAPSDSDEADSGSDATGAGELPPVQQEPTLAKLDFPDPAGDQFGAAPSEPHADDDAALMPIAQREPAETAEAESQSNPFAFLDSGPPSQNEPAAAPAQDEPAQPNPFAAIAHATPQQPDAEPEAPGRASYNPFAIDETPAAEGEPATPSTRELAASDSQQPGRVFMDNPAAATEDSPSEMRVAQADSSLKPLPPEHPGPVLMTPPAANSPEPSPHRTGLVPALAETESDTPTGPQIEPAAAEEAAPANDTPVFIPFAPNRESATTAQDAPAEESEITTPETLGPDPFSFPDDLTESPNQSSDMPLGAPAATSTPEVADNPFATPAEDEQPTPAEPNPFAESSIPATAGGQDAGNGELQMRPLDRSAPDAATPPAETDGGPFGNPVPAADPFSAPPQNEPEDPDTSDAPVNSDAPETGGEAEPLPQLDFGGNERPRLSIPGGAMPRERSSIPTVAQPGPSPAESAADTAPEAEPEGESIPLPSLDMPAAEPEPATEEPTPLPEFSFDPEPAEPQPVQPEPEPVQIMPAEPESTQPEPVQPQPAQPEPSSIPLTSEPVERSNPPSRPDAMELVGDAVPDRTAPAGPQQPELKIEKIAPPQAILGEPVIYEILIRNVGDSAAQDVIVEDRIPRGATLTGTKPRAELIDRRLTWRLGSIKPGQEESIKIRVIPTEPGEIGSVATVRFVAAVTASTVITSPKIDIAIHGPRELVVGEPATFRFKLTNNGSADADKVYVRNVLPIGLSHEGGRDLEYEIGKLPAGKSREVELTVTAVQTGEFQNQAMGIIGTSSKCEATIPVRVIDSRLSIKRTGPARRFVGRPATYETVVTNHSAQTLRNITVDEELPTGLEPAGLPEGGRYDAAKRKNTWMIGQLEPGQSQTFQSKLLATQTGRLQTYVSVSDAAGNRAEATSELEAAGVSSLTVDVLDTSHDGRPIPVGEQVSLRLKVRNRGSAEANNVQVVFELPDELEFVTANGPVDFEQDGQSVRFAVVEQLGVDEESEFDVVLSASREGTTRVKAKLSSAEQGLIIQDQPVRIY